MSIDVVINEGPIDVVLALESDGINVTLGDVGPMGPQGPPGIPGSAIIRVLDLIGGSSATPNASLYDAVDVTGIASDFTFQNPVGTPGDLQKLIVRIIDNGTPQNLFWGNSYVQAGIALPAVTLAGQWMHMGFVYNQNIGKWMLIAYLTQQ